MWERKELKQRAKDVLRFSYWKAFVASIVLGIGGGGISSPGDLINVTLQGNDLEELGFDLEFLMLILTAIIGVLIVFILIGIAFRIFLGAPLQVGATRYFKRAAEDDYNLRYVFSGFTQGVYLNIVKTMFWTGLLNFLWFLLLIIPGIVKAFAYSMVPYILADNPNINYRRAVELSVQMTNGHKFRIFVLGLSFIGWVLLGLLALGIGIWFVMPYIHATNAQLYIRLRKLAFESGLTNREELYLANPYV